MRKWYLPLAVLGVGGLGAILLTDTGRRALRAMSAGLHSASGTLLDFNESAQRELDRIQLALNRVAESLETVR